MLEHDANELLLYVGKHIQPSFDNVLDARSFLHPRIGTEETEAHVVIPVTGGKTAREVFARIVSKMGGVGQIPFPNNRSEVSCILQTIQARELKLERQHPGTLWILTLNSRPLVTLPDEAPAFDIHELFARAEPECRDEHQPYDFGHSYKDSSAYIGSSTGSQDGDGEKKDESIMSFSFEIGKRLCEHDSVSDLLVTPWRSAYGPNGSNINFVAVHGFERQSKAVQFATDVVNSVPRVINVSLMDLKMPGIECGPQWKQRYVVRFAETTPN